MKNKDLMTRKEKEMVVYFLASAIEENDKNIILEKEIDTVFKSLKNNPSPKIFNDSIKEIKNLRSNSFTDDNKMLNSVKLISAAYIAKLAEKEIMKSLKTAF